MINPSLYEGMPNVVLEAMACGRSVLASRVPGNDSVVLDQVTGWLYPSNDGAGIPSRPAHDARRAWTGPAFWAGGAGPGGRRILVGRLRSKLS